MAEAQHGYYHVAFTFTLHGQVCQNGFYFRDASLPQEPFDYAQSAVNLMTNFNAVIMPLCKDFMSMECNFNRLAVATIWPRNGPIVESIYETENGNRPNESLPSFVAGLLSHRTGLGGASRRGRSYFAGVPEDESANSKLEPSEFSRLQSIGNGLVSNYSAVNNNRAWDFGVFSQHILTLEGCSRDNYQCYIQAFTPVTHSVARINLATQNHRKIGHGN